MRKKIGRIKNLFAILGCVLVSYVQAQVIDISTGVKNSDGSLLAYNSLDDTWRMKRPGATSELTPRVCTLSAWQQNNCSRWISPDVFQGEAILTAGGIYTYIARPVVTAGRVDCASIIINSIGGDNRITGLWVNGHAYALNLPAGDHFNPMVGSRTLVLNPAHIIPGGTNKIEVKVQNIVNTIDTYTGFNLCGELHINDGNFNINPEISGASVFCQGSPISVNGFLASGSGTPTHHLWGIKECDASGNDIPGGFSWESWYVGVPTAHTFPVSLGYACNKYYRIFLAAVVESDCDNWAQENKVVYYSCKPWASAGADQTICEGECVTLGSLLNQKKVTYAWTIGGGPVFSTSAVPTVCPESTTTYTLTVTNQYGCTATDQVTVYVNPNDPSFSAYINTTNSAYFTVTATANDLTPYSQPGFMFDWMIEELNPIAGYIPYYQHHGYNGLGDNSCWWTFPNQVFKGYVSTPGNFTQATPCNSSSATGRFLYGRTYRITRTTWNDNCPQSSYSILFSPTYGKGTGGPGVMITEDVESPVIQSTGIRKPETETRSEDAIRIYPNPSDGIFAVQIEQGTAASVDVFDLFGKKIQSRMIPAGNGTLQIDLSGYSKGMYLLHITVGGKTSTHKVILQ